MLWLMGMLFMYNLMGLVIFIDFGLTMSKCNGITGPLIFVQDGIALINDVTSIKLYYSLQYYHSVFLVYFLGDFCVVYGHFSIISRSVIIFLYSWV